MSLCTPSVTWCPGPADSVAPVAGALHHPMFAVDIIGFGRRPAAIHPHLRDALYRVVSSAFAAVTVPLDLCHHEDRGDGIMVIAPTRVSVELLLGPLTTHLQAALRRHNQVSSPDGRLRLRTAVNAGYLRMDGHGVSGRALVHLFRLLDSPAFKAAVDRHQSDLGLVTSQDLYQEIVHDGQSLIDPASFLPITVELKETTACAWAWFPPATAKSVEDRDPGGPRVRLFYRPLAALTLLPGRRALPQPRRERLEAG